MKVREAIRLIEDDGWLHIATRGTERSIMRQAGLEKDP
jgi:predicted RNA binding protein YcfA (HicA-like mRNA interferase family)